MTTVLPTTAKEAVSIEIGGTAIALHTEDALFRRLIENRYEGFVGADVRIAPILDWRVIEVGIGNMTRIGDGTVVTTSASATGVPVTTAPTSSSIGVRSIGAGLVFHLPSK